MADKGLITKAQLRQAMQEVDNALDTKSEIEHTHNISDVAELETELAQKAQVQIITWEDDD